MARTQQALRLLYPDVEVLTFPAWDCLPYDRVSPNAEITSRRIDALTRLEEAPDAPRIVLTTMNAALQRVPPRKAFEERVLRLGAGGTMPVERLMSVLGRNGYTRSDTVREPGEFAVRGGIVDLYPSGARSPLRLDFFGDVIEGMRHFDALSQRTTGPAEALVIKPVNEVLLDDATIQRFRTRYREQFGLAVNDDPLYEAVSAGHRYIGVEHWLPLFYESLETIFDYLPGAAVALDYQSDGVRADRLDTINDFYAARRDTGSVKGAVVYRPVEPKQLFLDDKEWTQALHTRAVVELSPFTSAEGVDGGGKPGIDFAVARANPSQNLFEIVREQVSEEIAAGKRVMVAAYSVGSGERLGSLLKEHGAGEARQVGDWNEFRELPPHTLGLAVLAIEHGFRFDDTVVLTEQDMLGDRLSRPARRRTNYDQFVAEVATLQPGDLVVHAEHGIGRYDGLIALDVGGAPHDCLRVTYSGDDKLFVPVENIEVLSRYGSEESSVQLDKLGAASWQSRKSRVKKRIKDIADELIQVAAERQLKEGEPLAPPEGAYEEFAARFPFAETDDQDKAILDSFSDMASGRPMDRLICGDVGFGKTEVALRAAFVAAMGGMQVAVVVPTTLLARQHFRTFSARFAGLPLRIEQLSRLVSAKQATLDRNRRLAEGKIDIVVGTHSLLAKGMAFRHLGLLIIDEEQHFGVQQKERLKQLKANVHVLTLTATPIPRTLQFWHWPACAI